MAVCRGRMVPSCGRVVNSESPSACRLVNVCTVRHARAQVMGPDARESKRQ